VLRGGWAGTRPAPTAVPLFRLPGGPARPTRHAPTTVLPARLGGRVPHLPKASKKSWKCTRICSLAGKLATCCPPKWANANCQLFCPCPLAPCSSSAWPVWP
jgi:hypothetical protein